MSTIGEKIYQLRSERGLTQSELAEAIGETKQTIYKYERGIVTNIPLPKIEAIAKVLNCPPAALTGWVDSSALPSKDSIIAPDMPEITMIARAGKKMSPERRADMLKMLKIAFPEAFSEDD